MPKQRLRFLLLGFCLLWLVVSIHLAITQLLRGSSLAQLAVSQRRISYPLDSGRGTIFDRNGMPLTNNESSYSVVAVPSLLRSQESVIQMLSAMLGLSSEVINSRLRGSNIVEIADNINYSQASAIQNMRLSGVAVVRKEERYGLTTIAPHVIGYLSDERGAAGIERLLDRELGRVGGGKIAAYVSGKQEFLQGLGFRVPAPKSSGSAVYLTLDYETQKIVETSLKESVERGAAVVLDASSGDVLAMASVPDFNPALISTKDYWNMLSSDPSSPLVNRAVKAYAPGSIFKLVVAIAAMENRMASLHDRYLCKGGIQLGNRWFRCSVTQNSGHGDLSLEQAIAYSCNAAFIDLGLKVGQEAILRYARILGFGERVGILPEESSGYLPDFPLFDGDVANISIGQGPITVTPLQVARFMLSIAKNGMMLPVKIVKQIEPSGGIVFDRDRVAGFLQRPVRVMDIETAGQLRKALRLVVTQGTGARAETPAGSAGKTGTAERDGSLPSDAWFAGYVPAEAPRFVIVVLVEGGGPASNSAAPVFQAIAAKLVPSGE